MTGDGIHRFWAFRLVGGRACATSLRRDVAARCRIAAAEGFAADLHDDSGCLFQGPIVVGVVLASSDEPVELAVRRARYFRVAEVVDRWGTEVIEATVLTDREVPTLADVEVAA